MAIATQGTASHYLQRAPSPSGLADLADLILDNGLVIASVDTYLRFAEQVNRLDLTQTELAGLPELQEKSSEKMTEGAIEGVVDEITPDSPVAKTAAKGAATAAAVGVAAALAKELADRLGSNNED
jgi:hypothetical protein